MDVILHLGAHRTGTKTFQNYLRRQATALAVDDVAVWLPRSQAHGIYETSHADAPRRVQRQLDRMEANGTRLLLATDENLLGALDRTVADRALYASAGERMAHVARLFGGRLSGLVLSLRGLDTFWCSALAAEVARGAGVPDRARLHDMATSARGWREVVTDVAEALPGVPMRVLPFEVFRGRPDAFLASATGVTAPFETHRQCLNRAPDLPQLRRALSRRGQSPALLPFGMGRWNPFTNEEHAILRERHADDMMWLTGGANGLATLTEDRVRNRAGSNPPPGNEDKGRHDDHEERRLAWPGRR